MLDSPLGQPLSRSSLVSLLALDPQLHTPCISSPNHHLLFVQVSDWHSMKQSPVWARERCRISPRRFLAECCKRQLNQGSFVLLYFRLSTFSDLHWVCLSVFSSSTVLFVSISQVIGCEDRLRNDLYCVEWGVTLYSNQQPTCITLSCSPYRRSKFTHSDANCCLAYTVRSCTVRCVYTVQYSWVLCACVCHQRLQTLCPDARVAMGEGRLAQWWRTRLVCPPSPSKSSD